MIFMAELTFGSNFFIGGKSAALKPFSTVSQGIWNKERKNFAACLLWTIIFCQGKLTDNQSWCEKLKPFKNWRLTGASFWTLSKQFLLTATIERAIRLRRIRLTDLSLPWGACLERKPPKEEKVGPLEMQVSWRAGLFSPPVARYIIKRVIFADPKTAHCLGS